MGMYYFKKEDIIPVTEETLGGNQKSVQVIDPDHESKCPLYAGVSEFSKDEDPCIFAHDDIGNIAYILEGELVVKSNLSDEEITAKPGDMLYFAQKEGMRITMYAPEYCKLFWAA